MPFRLIGIFTFPLEQFFLTRDFPIFSSLLLFFIIIFFFLSHRPSALRKRRKGLIFTQNISVGNGGVHHHQVIVPFLLYNTKTKSRGLQLHITERCHRPSTTTRHLFQRCSVSLWRRNAALWLHCFPPVSSIIDSILFCCFCLIFLFVLFVFCLFVFVLHCWFVVFVLLFCAVCVFLICRVCLF